MTKPSIISTLTAALRLGWQHRWLVLILAVICDIPTTLMTDFTFHLTPPPPNPNASPDMGHVGMTALFIGVSSLLLLAISIGLTNMTTASLLGVLKAQPSEVELWPTIKASIRSYTWPLIIVSIILAVLACLIMIPFTLVIALFGIKGVVAGPNGPVVHSYFIDFIAILMAVIYLIFVKYALASPVIVLENKRPMAALEKSWQITRGFFWYVLGSYVFLGTAEYFIDALFQHFESSTALSWTIVIRLFIDSVIQFYWILLAWCMYWQIKGTEATTPFPAATT